MLDSINMKLTLLKVRMQRSGIDTINKITILV